MTHPTTERPFKDPVQDQVQVQNNAPSTKSNDNVSCLPLLLESIRIVMVNTTLPANIGSAARAMLTMGLTDLVVVDPKHPIDEDSVSHAAGAQSVLANCHIVDSLKEAINDCHLVFAASSRQRYIPRPVVTPTQAAQLITHFVTSHKTVDSMGSDISQSMKVAILFGREDRGLTNDELALSDYHIQIDANPEYPVLNVASAVQVIAAFFYSHFVQYDKQQANIHNASLPPLAEMATDNASKNHSHTHTNDTTTNTPDSTVDIILRHVWDSPAITHQQKLSLQSRIIDLMYELELIESTDIVNLKSLPNRLSRLLSRLQLDTKEFELLNSIIAKVNRRI